MLSVAVGVSASLVSVVSAVNLPIKISVITAFSLGFLFIGLPYSIFIVYCAKKIVAVASE